MVKKNREKKIEILVVEDSTTDVYIFKINLEKSKLKNFGISHASTGEEGLALLKEKPFDVIFLDYRLPDMDGIAFLKEIQCDYNAPPVIMLSGQGSENVAVTAMKDGAHNYITKDSLTPENLENVIKVTLEEFAEKKRAEKNNLLARDMAIHDPLTGLFNRREFEKILINEFKKARRFHLNLSLIFLDIDHFKNINDTWDHAAGDKVLKFFADTIKKTGRDIDVICRYGGEEFIILLPNTDEASAVNLALRIKENLNSSTFNIEGVDITITASQGISFIFDHAIKTPEDMIKFADKAMYRAKASGRNSICTAKIFVGRHPSIFNSIKTNNFKKEIQGRRKKIKGCYSDFLFEIFCDLTKENPNLRSHNLEVAKYSVVLAKRLKQDEESISGIENSAVLHDIALAGVEDKSNMDESLELNSFNITQLTIEILNNYKVLDTEIPVILHLNEWFDGSGQPYQLKGDLIPLGSRIISSVDFYQTLISPPFTSQPSYSHEKVVEKLKALSGTRFDPIVVENLIEIINNIDVQ